MGDLLALAAAIESGSSANSLVPLIAALASSETSPVVLKTLIQSLKLFFLDAGQDGDLLLAKKAQVASEPQPEDVYRSWLRRQYALYITSLLSLLTRPPGLPAGVQVAATAAIMEAVRSEQGVGVFSNGLFLRLLTTMVTSAALKAEVFTLFFGRYLQQYADVRYYTLWAVREISLSRSAPGGGGAGGASSKDPLSTKKSKKSSTAASATVTEGVSEKEQQPAEDVARMLFDLLANAPPENPGTRPKASSALVRGRPAPLLAVDKEEEEKQELKSWCCLEQMGGGGGKGGGGEVRASADRNESSKARRKRKAEETSSSSSSSSASAADQQAQWANFKSQRRVFSEAWLAFLQLPSVPSDILRKVLLRLHASVIPNMTDPVMLSDFLTHALDQGGIVGMLALNGIFILVTQHSLEYPDFYPRLYQMVTADSFAAKHRAQFYKLADLFLSSGLVPAYTAAAFAKRMARLALLAPPAGAMTAIAFIHNLIRRHPAISTLIDRPLQPLATSSPQGDQHEDKEEEEEEKRTAAGARGGGSGEEGLDVYDMEEVDPAKSRAVESSLWELGALRNHYCPQVAALCSILDKDLGDRKLTTEVDVDPVLAASYSSLFKQEAERRLKAVPLAFYQHPPTKLFDSAISGGWDF